MWKLILLVLAALSGFWWGKSPTPPKKEPLAALHPEREFPISEHKSFAIVVYAHNQALWCERALRSIFEQNYDHYRIIVVDDASIDGTYEKANQFIIGNNQESRVILIRNESSLGPVASLYRAVDTCFDREIIIPLDAKDWLVHPMALARLNAAYQNPDVWMAHPLLVDYPSYEIHEGGTLTFYAALFKQIHLQDLYKKGHFATAQLSYSVPLTDLAGGRIRTLDEPIAFFNTVGRVRPDENPSEIGSYAPLSAFPMAKAATKAEILIFSFDRPLQLYACLESIQRYFSGFEKLTVLYRVSDAQFAAGYDKVKDAFPLFHFVQQSAADPKHDFKPHVEKIVFDSPSEYILFGVDDIIVKDFVDLSLCMDQMEKTDAYGFYLRFGKHIHHCYQANQPQSVPPSLPLASGIYAWDVQTGEGDWAFPNSLDMTLFKKGRMRKAFSQMKFKTPNSLEFVWAKEHAPQQALGLYFETSKIVNIPLNLVGRTGNPHMNYLTTEELLVKFNQGLKIDIEPLYKIDNPSPHFDYIPEFIAR